MKNSYEISQFDLTLSYHSKGSHQTKRNEDSCGLYLNTCSKEGLILHFENHEVKKEVKSKMQKWFSKLKKKYPETNNNQ